MADERDERTQVEEAVRRCYSTWSGSYYQDYYRSAAAYPPIHVDIVRAELVKAKAHTLLDAGCGPASMLQDLDDLGLERFGFDLTEEMVAQARRVLQAQGLAAERVWRGSVLDRDAYRAPAGGYDAAICFGVLPHIPAREDAAVLANLTSAVKPGGLVLAEARNQLFALFTLNRYSRNFFRDDLIDEKRLRAATDPSEQSGLDEALKELDARFRLDLPPIRTGKADEPGYDEVLSRTHNPFELREVASAAGLVDVEILFYHYHCLPPLAERHLPKTFRARSVAMENPRDWRGHFLASAFIVKGRKPSR
jgi:2-polyprenyl-3-methyl-5-hydroxy-6-metoxy-1,4-benzoquinol methylase